MTATQLSDALGLATIKNRQWSIQETSATEGKGAWQCVAVGLSLASNALQAASR